MKYRKLFWLLSVPLLLVGCNKNVKRHKSSSLLTSTTSAQKSSTNSPASSASTSSVDPKYIDFSKLTEEEALIYFTVNKDAVITNDSTSSEAPDQTYPSVESNLTQSIKIIKEGNKYQISEKEIIDFSVNKSEASGYLNKILGSKVTTDDTVVDFFLNTFCPMYGAVGTFENNVLKSSKTEIKDDVYMSISPDSVFNDVYTKGSAKYIKASQFDVDPFDKFDVSIMAKIAKYFTYDASSEKYVLDPNKIPPIEDLYIQTFESGYFTLKDNLVDTVVLSATFEFYGEKSKVSDKVSVTPQVTSVVLPTDLEEHACTYSESFVQKQSRVDEQHYHFKECSECLNIKECGKCTFDEDGVCEVCQNQPTKYIDYCKIDGENPLYLVMANYNILNNKLINMIGNPALETYIEAMFKSVTYNQVDYTGGKYVYTQDVRKNGDDFVIVLGVTNDPTTSMTFYVIYQAQIISEDDESIVFDEGQVQIFEKGQVLEI